MNNQEKLNLIKKNIQEIIGEEELVKLINSGKEISLYWGTMPTGSISFAYFFPMLKIADFLKAGFRIKILFADIHAALDSTPFEELEKRMNYYEIAIKTILKTIGAPLEKLEFVTGSNFQMSKEYYFDLLKFSTVASIHDAKKAASEVVKIKDNPKLSGVIYPLMQVLDEEYLKVNAQFGGMDQRKIMVFARENLPKLGYSPRIEIINPIVRGLVGEKMSSSDKNTKIDLMDSEDEVKKKINKAACVAGEVKNGLMDVLKYVIFNIKEKFVIERPEKYGGNKEYFSFEEVKKDFVNLNLHPMDLKNSLAKEINNLLKNFREDKKIVELHKIAYGEK
jgi:tyrosyl-tRNA synthetase